VNKRCDYHIDFFFLENIFMNACGSCCKKPFNCVLIYNFSPGLCDCRITDESFKVHVGSFFVFDRQKSKII
jgi:hypothetical protein